MQQTGSDERRAGRILTGVSIPLLTAAAGLVVGLVVGSWFVGRYERAVPALSDQAVRTPDVPRVNDGDRADGGSLDREVLEAALEDERRTRQALEAQLEALQASLDAGDRGDEIPSLEIPDIEEAAPPRLRPTSNHQGEPWFDRDALETVGLASSEIDEIERLWEAFEMEKLYLVDASKRDGTFRTGAYNRALSEMRIALREDLGPEGYDGYLYATGRDNRVIVRDVLDDSPASYAGLEGGDIVIRYAGERIFHPGEFKEATTIGEPGGLVALEVQREGELMRYSVPRGPLGIRISHEKQAPFRSR